MLVRVSTRRVADLLIFPALVASMTAWALLAPALDLRALGIPAAARTGVLLGIGVVVFYALIALLERLSPQRRDWIASHGDLRTDALHLVFSGAGGQLLYQTAVGAGALSAAAWVATRAGGALWPLHWHPLAQLLLALCVAELGHYAFHRLSHENPWVWRLHATHHSAPRLYWLNATRFHVLDVFCLIACQTLPLVLLGADASALLSYAVFTSIYGQLQHANIRLRTGPLDFLFSTPGLHRWHHSRDPREGNHNYGAVLSCWDLLFRSFFRPRGRELAGAVGIGALPHFPAGYLAQQLSPFRWQRVRAESA
jgi:sterol desaturase/sphingolipid hydroxylase (fatty acid hydroxylase superfamily)